MSAAIQVSAHMAVAHRHAARIDLRPSAFYSITIHNRANPDAVKYTVVEFKFLLIS